MKRLGYFLAALLSAAAFTSCDYFYSLDIENQYDEGIYVWSAGTGLKTGKDDPETLDELDSKWYLNYVEPGKMGSFADIMGGRRVNAQRVLDSVFGDSEVLMVAIFDAKTLNENWGQGKMSDYVIQRYWLRKEDVIEDDGKTYKKISFPPNEEMKSVEMEPPFGTYRQVSGE